MTHFVAALHLAGAPLPRGEIARLAPGLPRVGPLRVLARGPFAVAERALACDGPPLAEGKRVLAGSARLDALGPRPRAEHLRALLARWRRGGEGALRGLRGDLGCVGYDAARGVLVALRDLIGVAPLYRARAGPLLLLASDPGPLLRHPDVDRRPDPRALGDFLLTGQNAWPGRSYHRGIRRVPPGFRLVVSAGRLREERHDRLAAAAWDAPAPRPGRDDGAVAEALRGRLGAAVARRLPAEGATILLSGGLDSAAVAAGAAAELGGRAPERLLAATFGGDPGLDAEIRHAGGVAGQLGLPHHVDASEPKPLFAPERLDALSDPAGPALDPRDPGSLWPRAAAHAPVVLTGFGGDPALRPSPGELLRLLRRGHADAALRALADHLLRFRRPPRIGLRAALRRRRRSARADGYPAWLAPDFERALGLRERWEALGAAALPCDPDRRRPEAVASLMSPCWASFCEAQAPSAETPLLVRHPWLDAELLEWLLGLPSLPWCVEKHALREALRGRIPEATRRRPKATLAGLPPEPLSARHVAELVDRLRAAEELPAYVDVEAVAAELWQALREGGASGAARWVSVLPAIGAGLWLGALQRGERSHEEELHHVA